MKEASKMRNFPNVVKVLRMFVYLIFLVVHFVLLCLCLLVILVYLLQSVQRSFVDVERVCALQPIHSTKLFFPQSTLYFLHRGSNVATLVVQCGYTGFPIRLHRLSNVATPVIQCGYTGCPMWLLRLSNVTTPVVPFLLNIDLVFDIVLV